MADKIMKTLNGYEIYDEYARNRLISLAQEIASNLANYYLKTETYSKTEIDNLVSTIPKFSIQVVTTLPSSNISTTTVYLVKDGSDSGNLYTEYIYVDGAWEVLGSQRIDLSGYALTTDIPTKLSDLDNDSGYITNTVNNLVNYYTTSQIDSKLNELKNAQIAVDTTLTESGKAADAQIVGQKFDELSEQIESVTVLPYGGSKEWLVANGNTDQLYQIDGYVWGYIESDGWTRSNRQFRVVSSESEMTNQSGTPYLLRKNNTGTVYAFEEASGDVGVPVYDKLPETANDGDIVAVKETVVSSVDEMTDTSKTYILESTGTVWEYTTHTTEVEPVELYDPSAITVGKRHSGTPGTIVDGATYIMTDYIPVDITQENPSLNIYGDIDDYNDGGKPSFQKIAFYNSSKECVGSKYIACNNLTVSTAYAQYIDGGTNVRLDVDGTGTEYTFRSEIAFVRIEVIPTGDAASASNASVITSIVDPTIRIAEVSEWTDTNKTGNKKYKATVSETEQTLTWTEIGTYIEPTNSGWYATSETHKIIDSIETTSTSGDSAVYSGDGYLYTYIVGADWMELSESNGANTVIDTELSFTSKNAVQNKVVTTKIDELATTLQSHQSSITELSEKVTRIDLSGSNSTGSTELSIPTFWQDSVDECISKIKELQLGRRCVTFPFFSDNHQRNGYAGLLIAYIMQECHIPYAFFGGDSISSGYIADEATMIEQDRLFDLSIAYIPKGRFCRAVGNHDGYWAVSSSEKYYYTDAQNYELFLREESTSQTKHFGGDGTYYYVEDFASKTRFVVLDTNDTTVEQEQLDWLQNVALKFNETGWGVVFFSHQPISNHYHALINNCESIRTIVQNHISSSDANKADIIGWFSGHIHRDRIYSGIAVNTSDDSEGADMGFKQVTITSDHTGIAYDDATKHTVANDNLSHAIDFVTINRATRTVNITRLGIGNDRNYTY